MLKINSSITSFQCLPGCVPGKKKSRYMAPEVRSLALENPILSGSVPQSEISVNPFENDDDINL